MNNSTSLQLNKSHCLGNTYRGYTVTPLSSVKFKDKIIKVTLDPCYVSKMDLEIFDPATTPTTDYIHLDNTNINSKTVRERIVKLNNSRAVARLERLLKHPHKLIDRSEYGTPSVVVYLSDVSDLDLIINRFVFISEVAGILDELHIELMNDENFILEVKDKPYYGKYEYKLVARFPISQWRHLPKDNRFSTITDFVQSQAEPDEYILRKNWADISIFCNKDLATEVFPYALLSIPDLKYSVYRCVTA